MLSEEMRNRVRVLAIQNRIKHGNALPKFVFSSFMREFKDKIDISKLKEYMGEIEKICEEVNSLSQEEISSFNVSSEKRTKEINVYDIVHLLENLKELPTDERGVVTRFEPSASGPLHLGHVFPLLLNYWYAQKYKGKFVLRIADTNPKNILPEAYVLIPEDVEYLVGEFIKPVVQSERMNLYYEVGEYLIEKGFAYVCSCSDEEFRKYLSSGMPCPHRDQSVEENISLWEKMLEGAFEEHTYVVRIKTSVQHKNPAVREWVAFRIIKHPHPILGNDYSLYPTMNFSVAVDDHLLGITHVIRGKDHEVNTMRQEYVYEYMGWRKPYFVHIGRVNFEDLRLSTTETKKLINEGKYSGWDDVRLPTIRAFKKRGFKREAFSIWVLQIGLTKRDKKTSYKEFMKNFIKIHRVLIDREARRLFYVKEPVKIKLINLREDKVVSLDYHPDVPKYGKRLLRFSASHPFVYLDKKDWENIDEGEVLRLKGAFNIKKLSSTDAEIVNETHKAIIHYVPVDNGIKGMVVMDDGRVIEGIVENNITSFAPESVFQFERFGFVKLERNVKENLYIYAQLYYIHE